MQLVFRTHSSYFLNAPYLLASAIFHIKFGTLLEHKHRRLPRNLLKNVKKNIIEKEYKQLTHNGPDNYEKSRPKNSSNDIKSISQDFFSISSLIKKNFTFGQPLMELSTYSTVHIKLHKSFMLCRPVFFFLPQYYRGKSKYLMR